MASAATSKGINLSQNELCLTNDSSFNFQIFLQNLSIMTHHRRIVIFDWDDTLCVTTGILNKSRDEINKICGSKLKIYGQLLYKLLLKYIGIFGAENVMIITNAKRKWVFTSIFALMRIYHERILYDKKLKKETINYFIEIYNLLIFKNIRIVSAQDLYGNDNPNQFVLWKILTFQTEIVKHFDVKYGFDNNYVDKNKKINKNYTIINIGDSDDEFIASYQSKIMLQKAYKLKNIHLQRFKLSRNPELDVIISQMRTLCNLAHDLINDLDKKSFVMNEGDEW